MLLSSPIENDPVLQYRKLKLAPSALHELRWHMPTCMCLCACTVCMFPNWFAFYMQWQLLKPTTT